MLLNITLEELNVLKIIEILGLSTALGLLLCGVLILTHRKEGFERAFGTTLVLLPPIISIIIVLVSNDFARAISLAGVFTLVRFRSAVTDTRDIAYVFSTVAIGLAVGLGYFLYAIVIACFLALVLIVIYLTKVDQEKGNIAKLKIVIPESLNYMNAFDEIFAKYLISCTLQRVKTVDFGTMFELSYKVNIKKDANQKEMLDEIRVKNGNLNVSLTAEYVYRLGE